MHHVAFCTFVHISERFVMSSKIIEIYRDTINHWLSNEVTWHFFFLVGTYLVSCFILQKVNETLNCSMPQAVVSPLWGVTAQTSPRVIKLTGTIPAFVARFLECGVSFVNSCCCFLPSRRTRPIRLFRRLQSTCEERRLAGPRRTNPARRMF